MKTIKIILNDDGSVLSLSCGFQLNQYSYNDTLLNVYVPSNILENQTDLENVDYSNNVVMGMYYTLANGSQKVGNPYYFTFVKDNVVIDNKLYTLYERKMPKEFTLYYGTQTYCINVVALKTTIVNNVATNEVVGNITSNNFELNIVRSMNMVDEGIEEDTDLSTLIANVNSLLANMLLKQDKSDSLIQVSIANGSNVKTSVVREALNVLNQRVAENFNAVTTNTGDITQLKQDVIDINNQLLTSFRYCGSYTSPNAPTNPRLNQLMTTWGLTARNGDVIIWTWTKSSATDVSYTCRYNVNNTWDTIEIPTVETASNTEMGLIQGNYNENLTPSDTTPNILASIVGGKIVDIYYKRGGIYHNLQVDFNGVYAVLNGLLSGTETATKSQYATYDNSEYGSNNPTPINQKYMTKSEGATKQFVTDYALPKTFNDIYRFDFTNNKLVSNSVNTSKTLATQLGSVDFGSYTIEKPSVLTFELSNKNTFSCNFYAMFDNNITDVTFTMIIKANNTPIASTTSETTDFTGGTYKKVSINGDFALLGDSEITIDENVTLSVELSANITTSATNNLTIYSNTTLPSAFTLNVASSTIIINGSGVLGGVNYHTLNGVKTNNECTFALPNDTTLVDATIHTFILNYSGISMQNITILYIKKGIVKYNINLPYNYNNGGTLNFEKASQFLAPNDTIVFTAIYENGFFTIIGGNTLSQTQIQAQLNAKQNVIDSGHKVNANYIAENSSRVFVTPAQKQQIGINTSNTLSLAQRVTTLENNPTSNVSGTNDGTNWTTITIGNETYAIPSGSSSGGSGSGETLKLIKLGAVWVDEVYIGMRGTEFETVLSRLSQAMGTTITEDMIPTLWANASDYEKLSVVYFLTLGKLFASWGANDVLAFTPTQTEIDGTTVVTSIALSYLNSSNQIATISTLEDLEQAGASISITTIGGGNGGSSASSGALYEFDMEVSTYDDSSNLIDNKKPLKLLIYESNFERFKAQASQLGITINTPNDLVTIINGTFVMTTGHQITNITSDVPAVLLGLLVLQSDKAYGLEDGINFDVFSANFFNIVNPLNKGIPYIHLLTDPLEYAYGINVNNSCTLSQYGTSGGSNVSGSGAYYEIKTSDIAFYDTDNQIVSKLLTNLTICMSEGQFEAFKAYANPLIAQMSMPTLTDINSLITLLNGVFTETDSDNNMAYQFFSFIAPYCRFIASLDLSGTGHPASVNLQFLADFEFCIIYGTSLDIETGTNFVYGEPLVNTNEFGISATWTLTEYGTSGGSSASESYYKIVLEDGSIKLNCIIYKDDFATMLTAINTQMGTSLATPTDLINLYDTMKGNSDNRDTLVGLFTALGSYSCDSNLNCVVKVANINSYKITGWGDNGLEYTTGGTHHLFSSSETYYIAFTSSSTLTITEQNNQKI